jgi:hypothetical protein
LHFFSFYKTSFLNEEVNRTDPFLSVSFSLWALSCKQGWQEEGKPKDNFGGGRSLPFCQRHHEVWLVHLAAFFFFFFFFPPSSPPSSGAGALSSTFTSSTGFSSTGFSSPPPATKSPQTALPSWCQVIKPFFFFVTDAAAK